MCTLSWTFEGGGYRIYFNRDESRERKLAQPPFIHQAQTGCQFIAPIDTEAGGSWIAVNEFGLSACLLNYYQGYEPVEADSITSRGSIVMALAACKSFSEAQHRVNTINLHAYSGFTLIVFQGCQVNGWQWNGRQLESIEPIAPMTSSLTRQNKVQAIRRQYFRQLPNMNSETLEKFHASHFETDLQSIDGEIIAEHSVCMHRSNSKTVSLCVVTVSELGVSMVYTQGSPCRNQPNLPIQLPRSNVRSN
jgi:hypothetical protein